MFIYGSERALAMEKIRNFNYANPVYLSNVLTAIMGMGVGALSLIGIGRMAEQQVEDGNIQKT